MNTVTGPAAPMILAGIGTKDVKRRFEQCAARGGYQVTEWLTLGQNGKGLRVVAAFKHKEHEYALGFKWDGVDINELASRCMALDMSMCGTRDMVLSGKAKAN
jgi:hypothetical protein